MMCILLLHYHPSSSGGTCKCPYILVAADNRDEFFERPTAPLAFWEENAYILAGRDIQREDLQDRGTWMGISSRRKFAVLTNYRTHAHEIQMNAKTRGCIVSDYLSGGTPPEEYCRTILGCGDDYNGFSLMAANLSSGNSELVYCSNRGGGGGGVRRLEPGNYGLSNRGGGGGGVRRLEPGNYGLSNALLDTPWMKVQRGKERLARVMEDVKLGTDKGHLTDMLMEILSDKTCLHPDPNIPDTGFDEDVLKFTSSVFVEPVSFYGHQYGTRTSSVVLVDRNGEVTFTERTRTFPQLPGNPEWTTTQHSFYFRLS